MFFSLLPRTMHSDALAGLPGALAADHVDVIIEALQATPVSESVAASMAGAHPRLVAALTTRMRRRRGSDFSTGALRLAMLTLAEDPSAAELVVRIANNPFSVRQARLFALEALETANLKSATKAASTFWARFDDDDVFEQRRRLRHRLAVRAKLAGDAR